MDRLVLAKKKLKKGEQFPRNNTLTSLYVDSLEKKYN